MIGDTHYETPRLIPSSLTSEFLDHHNGSLYGLKRSGSDGGSGLPRVASVRGYCQEFSIVLTARAVDGEPTPSDESREVQWVPLDEVKSLTMGRSMRLRIGHYLADRTAPYIG